MINDKTMQCSRVDVTVIKKLKGALPAKMICYQKNYFHSLRMQLSALSARCDLNLTTTTEKKRGVTSWDQFEMSHDDFADLQELLFYFAVCAG
jgi:NADPH-dependent 7-cyano-7-deazaguanine reductase QueF-like protein